MRTVNGIKVHIARDEPFAKWHAGLGRIVLLGDCPEFIICDSLEDAKSLIKAGYEVAPFSTKPLDDFTKAYIEAMLFFENDESDVPFSQNYDESDLAVETLLTIQRDCDKFQAENQALIAQAAELGDYASDSEWNEFQRAGHDFWLTRVGHGVGFWDRGLGKVGDKLTKAAKAFGEIWVYVGDDKLIYLSK